MIEDTFIRSAWSSGNADGLGFSLSDDDDDMDPLEAAEAGGLRNPVEVDGLDGGIVCGWQGDRLIAVGNAGGPWAVDITDECADYYRDVYGA